MAKKSKAAPATKKKDTSEKTLFLIPEGYKEFITKLKSKIQSSQIKAAISVNRELIRLYWDN